MNQAQTQARLVEDAFKDMLSADDFKSAFRNHPAGVSVVTADPGDGPVGLTATSVISVSANPPLLVFSLSAFSSAAPALARAETVVVHLLGVEQLEVAKVFATSGIDRFADRSSWSRLPTGEPILAHTPTWLRGRVVNRMSAGDSTVMAVQVLQAQVPGPDITSEPLVYHNRTWHSLSPQSARN
ncbi:flavin reductase family protein [Paenarthrobacter nitroguajacolicus]|uniref:flavin reductase family protein n=1 Tax=Paenarthrobacter nitroguajacolicus TaxID=211146 RepID=UPI003D1DCAAA